MTELAVGGRSAPEYVRGALYGLAAVGIWSGCISGRASRPQEQSPAMGYRPPSLWRRQLPPAGLSSSPRSCASIASAGSASRQWCSAAAPPVLLTNAGLMFARAARAGSVVSGVMPLMVALLAALILHEPFTAAKKIGFVLILCGVFGITWAAGSNAIQSRQSIGHLLFLGSALAWAFYTVAMRRARLDGLHAAAIAAVGALVLYMPIYLIMAGTSLAGAPWGDIALQAFRAGDFDGDRFAYLLRTCCQHPRRFQRCRIR